MAVLDALDKTGPKLTGQTPAIERPLPYVFGRYLLLKRLSRGGMGEIFLAKLGEIQGFEKLVIIKKILPNLVADEEFIKRFIDEAQVAIKLQHANIAPVFEVGKVDGEYFLAIEYIEGRDLRRLIARQREERTRLPTDLCLYICRELANGLAYAHRKTDEQGKTLALVHCDISPPNVMASFEGEVKVIDFGIAKSAVRIAASNPNMGFGKFGYMAPEQLVRGGVVDKRTDVYAAGVVLYELLTGERLFLFPEGADYRQIARMVTQGKITLPSVRDPRLDPGLDPIVMKALTTNKEDRYQTAEELRDAIQSKLSQLNPTISQDAMAHFLRGLFNDEITEEHRLVASMKAIDIAPFQDELTQATTQHTVTFARANVGARIMGRLSSGPSAAIHLSTGELRLARPGRRTLLVLGAVGAVVAGGTVALLLARAATRSPVVGVNTLPSAAARAPMTPVTTQLPAGAQPPGVARPTVAPPPAPKATQSAKRAPKHHNTAAVERASVAVREPAPQQGRRSPEAMQSKYLAVKSEYMSFRREYGAVLEEKFNAIANEVTYGKANKWERLDAMLDALRREMSRLKSGG